VKVKASAHKIYEHMCFIDNSVNHLLRWLKLGFFDLQSFFYLFNLLKSVVCLFCVGFKFNSI